MPGFRRKVALLCVAMGALHAAVGGHAASQKTFDVASIKRNTDVSTLATSGALPGGRFTMTNSSLQRAILFAHPVNSRELVGVPSWVISERYDITAIGAADSDRRVIEEMMRGLLADRLHLVVHTETRQRQRYALRLSRADGRLGPGLIRQPAVCTRAKVSDVANPVAANGGPLCGRAAGVGTIRIGGMPMADIAQALTPSAGRVVVDRTGLVGTYEASLDYAPDPASATDDRPTLFTAVREQLGLQLTPEEGPLDVLVIDRIERPAPD